jgi:flagellar motor switch protein FliG
MKGMQKAAAVLMTLGENLAGDVLRHMKQQEIQQLTGTMLKLGQMKNSEIETVSRDFVSVMEENSIVGVDGGQYMKNILSKTLGPEKASEFLENHLLAGAEEGLDALRTMEPRKVADIVRREHPQVVAFVLASLDPAKAGQVLQLLPEEMLGEVIYRISTMDEISSGVLSELEQAMKSHLAESTSGGAVITLGGVKFAAELVNRLGGQLERKVLDEIREIEESVSSQIEEQLFVFEDVVLLEDRTLQEILKEVSTDVIVLALRGVDEEVKNKFFKNMSERAVRIIKEEMEMRGPVRLKEVETAQQEVIKIAKGLEAAGKIVMGGKGAEDVYV